MNIIWFNGPSQLDLVDRLPPQDQEIGCNMISGRRSVDHVCVYDWQMLDKIAAGPRLWCRNGIKHPRFTEVPYPLRLQPHNSGVLALHLARHLKWDHAYIIGCDWGVSNQSVYDYGDRNSVLKYTNSQKHIVEEISATLKLCVVNDKPVDLRVDQIAIDNFLQVL